MRWRSIAFLQYSDGEAIDHNAGRDETFAPFGRVREIVVVTKGASEKLPYRGQVENALEA
jgi:hypothetical protein